MDVLVGKDLRIEEKKFNELELLFNKAKPHLSDDDKETMKSLMQKTINNYEKSKKQGVIKIPIEVKTENKIDKACKKYKLAHQSKQHKFNTLDNWLDKESSIFLNEVNNTPTTYKKFTRGQIIKVDFGINIGSELCYTHFAIVITKQDSIYSDIITIVPITSKNGNKRVSLGKILHKIYPNSKKYNLECFLNISQITAISKTRIFPSKKKFICDNLILNKIDSNLIELYTIKNDTIQDKKK